MKNSVIHQAFKTVAALAKSGDNTGAVAVLRALHIDIRPRPYRGSHTCGTGRGSDLGCPACWWDAMRRLACSHPILFNEEGVPHWVGKEALEEGRAVLAILKSRLPSREVKGPKTASMIQYERRCFHFRSTREDSGLRAALRLIRGNMESPYLRPTLEDVRALGWTLVHANLDHQLSR